MVVEDPAVLSLAAGKPRTTGAVAQTFPLDEEAPDVAGWSDCLQILRGSVVKCKSTRGESRLT